MIIKENSHDDETFEVNSIPTSASTKRVEMQIDIQRQQL